MFSYDYNKVFNVGRLFDELHAANIHPMCIDNETNSAFTICFNEELDEETKASLDALVDIHSASINMTDFVTAKIVDARRFGIQITASYGASNVLAGYSVEIIQDIMVRTAKAAAALNSGSLYVAIKELNAVETDESVITPEKIAAVRNKIEDYLNIPRT